MILSQLKRFTSLMKHSKRLISFKNFPKIEPTYGGRYVITMIPGTAMNPTLVGYIKEIFFELGIPIDFQEVSINLDNDEDAELAYIVSTLRRNVAAIGGPLGVHRTLNFDIEARKQLKMYQFCTHIQSYPYIPAKMQGIDVIVVRQNIGGEFTMTEHEAVPGVVTSLKVMEKENAENVVTFACNIAQNMKRKKVTAVHKANIIKLSDGLFLQVSKEVAKKYPDLKVNDMIVDNACMQLVQNPKQFDVLVTTNLYGMLAVNILAGITGGPGLHSGVNVGKDCVIFEASARAFGKELVGRNIANPVAMIQASRHLLEYLKFPQRAKLMGDAIIDTVCKKKIRTPDIGGNHTTSDVIDGIMHYIYENKSKINVLHTTCER